MVLSGLCVQTYPEMKRLDFFSAASFEEEYRRFRFGLRLGTLEKCLVVYAAAFESIRESSGRDLASLQNFRDLRKNSVDNYHGHGTTLSDISPYSWLMARTARLSVKQEFGIFRL